MNRGPNKAPLQSAVQSELDVTPSDSLLSETAREYLEGPALLSPREVTPAEDGAIIKRFLEHRSRVATELCGYDIFEHP